MAKLRPIAVSIVDAFDINDQSLLSTLGNQITLFFWGSFFFVPTLKLNFVLGSYDGQVYKRMFEAAEQSPLNQNDVQPAYQKYIKPILKANL